MMGIKFEIDHVVTTTTDADASQKITRRRCCIANKAIFPFPDLFFPCCMYFTSISNPTVSE